MYKALEAFMNYCDDMIIANEGTIKVIKRNESGRYTWLTLDKKIKDVNIICLASDEDKFDLLEVTSKFVIKEFENIKKHAASDMWKHINEIGSDRVEKYKNEETLCKNLKLKSVIFSTSRSGEICDYDMSFDTNPALDPSHVYTLYVDVKKKTGEVIYYDSVYDG